MRQLLFVLVLISFFTKANAQVGLQLYQTNAAYPGYTLFPTADAVYLINNCGQVIHSWNTTVNSTAAVDIMYDGSLLRLGNAQNGTSGNRFELYDSNGNLFWFYEYNISGERGLHHDLEPLPNGNFLGLSWVALSVPQAIAEGRDPSLLTGDQFLYERIIEVEILPNNQANIVWQWDMIDHVVQNIDASKENFGVIEQEPRKLNLNFTPSVFNPVDWLHFNGIHYNSNLDQIIVSSRNSNEVYVIDHSTTTTEAASANGGNSGHGGDFLFRYGNPSNYTLALIENRDFYFQHDSRWILDGPFENGFTVFNNIGGNANGDVSSIINIVQPLKDNIGNYVIASDQGAAFQVITDDIEIDNGPGGSFFSAKMSSAQGLSNGNVLIAPTEAGSIFEVHPITQEIVWHYNIPISPFPFKVNRYSADYSGLSNLISFPSGTIENPSSSLSEFCIAETEICNDLVYIENLPSSTNTAANSISLSAFPAGGIFSGPGVLFSAFNPGLAGPGNHIIEYGYTNMDGCLTSVTENILVVSINYNFVNYNLGTISP